MQSPSQIIQLPKRYASKVPNFNLQSTGKIIQHITDIHQNNHQPKKNILMIISITQAHTKKKSGYLHQEGSGAQEWKLGA